MVATILKLDACPLLMIGARFLNDEGRTDYVTASALSTEDILYVLGRVKGILEGRLPDHAPHTRN